MSYALRRVRVDDVELVYEDHGHGERALVLVHGFTGSRDDFADVTDALADLGRLLVVDQRGHGDSSHPGGAYSLARLVADLAGLLDAAGADRVDLLGHSLGGMVALRFTLAYPERVASLVLMDSAARGVAAAERMFAAAVATVERSGMAPIVESIAGGPLSAEERLIAALEGEERHRARQRRKLEALDPAAFVQLAPLLTTHEPLVDRLAELRCPVTVIVGEKDAPFVPLADELVAGIPGARLVVVPGAGHSPQKSGRDAWLAAVRGHVVAARGAAPAKR